MFSTFLYIIRIYQVCDDGIEKSIPRDYQSALQGMRVMTIGDHKGRIFLSHPHTKDGFFLLYTIKLLVLRFKNAPNSK